MFRPSRCQVCLLFGSFATCSRDKAVAADVRLTAFILEVDLSLLQWRIEEVVANQLHRRPCGRANAEPIEAQGVAARNPVLRIQRQEFSERFFLPPMHQVTLELSDDQSKPRDLGREVSQFDATKVRERNIGPAFRFVTAPVDLCFDGGAFPYRQSQGSCPSRRLDRDRIRAMRLRRLRSLRGLSPASSSFSRKSSRKRGLSTFRMFGTLV